MISHRTLDCSLLSSRPSRSAPRRGCILRRMLARFARSDYEVASVASSRDRLKTRTVEIPPHTPARLDGLPRAPAGPRGYLPYGEVREASGSNISVIYAPLPRER